MTSMYPLRPGRRRFLVGLAAGLCAPWVSTRVAAGQARTVQAEGFGSIIGGDTAQARDEAIVDARVRALEQVAGVFVDAETLVENAVLLGSLVRDRTQGLVTSYRILGEGPVDGGRYRVAIEARVVPEEVKRKLQGATSNFSMVVMIQETNLGRPHAPPIVENALVTKLVESGYRVADPGQVLKLREQERMKALLDNDLDAIRGIAGRFLATVLVMGRASTEQSQVTEGIVSVRGRVAVRAVEAETGRILLNRDIGEVRGFDLAADRAGQKALRNAAEAAGDYVLQQLNQHYKRHERTVEIRVRGLASVEDFQRFKNLLQSVRWVSDLDAKSYSLDASVYTLRYAEKAAFLASRISREPDYRVTHFDTNRLVVEVKR